MTQTCSKCGATLRASTRFCTVCGTAISTEVTTPPHPETPEPAAGSQCPNCGKSVKDTEKFCTRCGTQLDDQVTPPPQPRGESPVCMNCGNIKSPPGSRYCTRCGQELPGRTPDAETAPVDEAGIRICANCGQMVRPNTKFCVSCGSELPSGVSADTEPTITAEAEEAPAPVDEPKPAEPIESPPELTPDITPTPVPTDDFDILISRGRQLALEDQYAETGSESEELLDDLSEAAENGNYPLEELIDNFIGERTEQERLETLHQSGEVSERVFKRLSSEYEEKLARMNEEIQAGLTTLKGYLAQLHHDLNTAEEELETLEARSRIGDMEDDAEDQRSQLMEKVKQLRYAIAAAKHIINKEAAIHETPPSRFEVTETTLTDTDTTDAAPSPKPKPDPDSKSAFKSELEDLPEPVADAEAGKICPTCGRVTASDAKFCVHCGNPI